MQHFKESFYQQVNNRPCAIAIETQELTVSYLELAQEVKNISDKLIREQVRCIALAAPNSPAWIAFDLAAIFSNIVMVPIPHFFTRAQVRHLITQAGVDLVISNQGLNFKNDLEYADVNKFRLLKVFNQDWHAYRINRDGVKVKLPQDTLKISYTSGTTGQPKGVMISARQVDKVHESLRSALNADVGDHHLNALPFSLLLENIAGVYTVLASGGRCMVPGFDELGLTGSSSLDSQRFANTVKSYQPTTMITVPALAQALVQTSKSLGMTHDCLRYIAVGGAPVSASILNQADEIGLPLYEGYGLTECSSVTAMNTPEQHRQGSVGRPLAHINVEISEQNEVIISGALAHGYLDRTCHETKKWATGDLGYLDEDGFLYITGRKGTTYCTSYGRNISPEWVERELVIYPEIEQVMIYGEGKPFNIAIVVPGHNTSNSDIDNVILRANKALPDYARISTWVKADEPYSTKNEQLSASGMIQRRQIMDDYQSRIEHIYQ